MVSIFIGHGDLGKRVLDREMDRFETLAGRPALRRRKKIFLYQKKKFAGFLIRICQVHKKIVKGITAWFAQPEHRRVRHEKIHNWCADRLQNAQKRSRRVERWREGFLTANLKEAFFEVVTPDLRLEKLCSRAVVIERNLRDVVYSGNNALLGDYGVVSANRRKYSSKDARGNIIHPEKRVLVPIVRGEAREPFISSRVNLERAGLVISMVPDEESVQAVFERANRANVSSIICVNRSDQISYLTYRSRNRPIVLVYPKQNQGLTLGERLWAAIMKVRAVGNMSKRWPRVLIIGNNKANHYMLERIWAYLPGDHRQKNAVLRDHFKFIVTDANVTQEHPILRDAEERRAYDQSFDATFITSPRYPYPPQTIAAQDTIRALTRAVNTADIRALEACLQKHRPEILLINHEDVEKSLLMMSRCMRALERLKTRKPKRFHLPLLLLAAGRGDEWERLSLGDASRYYDALCKLNREKWSTDLSYPEHAHFDHFLNEQIGESIIDALSDVEEIITGARTILQDPLKPPSPTRDPGFPKRPSKPKFIEVNSCLPNRPGALANYLAELSGLSCTRKSAGELRRLWQKSVMIYLAELAGLPEEEKIAEEMQQRCEQAIQSRLSALTLVEKDREAGAKIWGEIAADFLRALWPRTRQQKSPADLQELYEQMNAATHNSMALLPSFQYLRNIMLDPTRQGFALSGFVTLSPLHKDFDLMNDNVNKDPLLVRIFANDGRRYADKAVDRDITQFAVNPMQLSKKLKSIPTPKPPGVPQVLDRMTRRTPNEYNRVSDFHKVMLDAEPGGATGPSACPGMSICRIAAFQDYVVASNSLRLQRFVQKPQKRSNHAAPLRHARNYFCCSSMSPATSEEVPHQDSPTARIFCCCRSNENQAGLIATVVNTLLFRHDFVREAESDKGGGDAEKDWVINMDYFKAISCQNTHFSLNRSFGYFESKPPGAVPIRDLPLQLLRILPIGSLDSARQWYLYSRALHRFLNSQNPKRKFNFYWIDEKRKTRELDEIPTFAPERRDFPVALVVKIERPPKPAEPEKFCELCLEQSRDYDCRKLRVWV